MNLLIVDDFLETAETLSLQWRLFSEIKQVHYALDGDEAQRMMSAQTYDIVSLDIQIADEDGLELLARLRPLFPETFFIMCSMDSSLANRRQAERLGASCFLEKPASHASLQNVLKQFHATMNRPDTTVVNDDSVEDLLKLLDIHDKP